MTIKLKVFCNECDKPYPDWNIIGDPSDVEDNMRELLECAENDGWKIEWEFCECTCPKCLEKI